MRVYIGSDHAGYEFKKAIIAHLEKNGYEPIDCGAYDYDADGNRTSMDDSLGGLVSKPITPETS